ncbi:MAG TPA: GNAT family N-acetyltransferase [Methanoregula sp.]|nr:GNAT family N-acetyltransferase [Methanoregula sp.]
MTGITETRELSSEEFPRAETIWLDYHSTRGDPATDRIFGVFAGGALVSVARCRRHPDGYEVDGVFTPGDLRGHAYAKHAVAGLVEACHNDDLYMHAVLELVPFYGEFGFMPIGEAELPPTIKARFDFALGEMEGANVRPMKRPAGLRLGMFRELLDPGHGLPGD